MARIRMRSTIEEVVVGPLRGKEEERSTMLFRADACTPNLKVHAYKVSTSVNRLPSEGAGPVIDDNLCTTFLSTCDSGRSFPFQARREGKLHIDGR